MVGRCGIPLAVWLTAANVHDSAIFEDLIDAIEPIQRPRGRRRKRPHTLHADKAYDFAGKRAALRQRGIVPRIARRGIDSSAHLGRFRRVVERILARVAEFRRLALLDLACALICFRSLQPN